MYPAPFGAFASNLDISGGKIRIPGKNWYWY